MTNKLFEKMIGLAIAISFLLFAGCARYYPVFKFQQERPLSYSKRNMYDYEDSIISVKWSLSNETAFFKMKNNTMNPIRVLQSDFYMSNIENRSCIADSIKGIVVYKKRRPQKAVMQISSVVLPFQSWIESGIDVSGNYYEFDGHWYETSFTPHFKRKEAEYHLNYLVNKTLGFLVPIIYNGNRIDYYFVLKLNGYDLYKYYGRKPDKLILRK